MPYFPPASGGGASVVVEIHRTLTSAEIKALFTTPIVLVAGVANKQYAILGCQLIHRFGGTAFGNVAQNLFISTGDQFNWLTFPANILAETADHIALQSAAFADWALASVEGQPLLIQVDTANPTLGNGTLEVWVWYVVTDV